MSIVSTNPNPNHCNPLNGGFRLFSPPQLSPNLPSRRNANLHLHIPSNSPFYKTSLGPLNDGFQVYEKPSPFPQIFFSPEIIQSARYPYPWVSVYNPVCPKYYPLFT